MAYLYIYVNTSSGNMHCPEGILSWENKLNSIEMIIMITVDPDEKHDNFSPLGPNVG